MATDPNPALRAELEAAEAVLEPQIRGLKAIGDDPTVSVDLRGQVQAQIDRRNQRLDLIQNVLNALNEVVTALDALVADGYPGLPSPALDDALFAELQQENADIEAAVGIFVIASTITGGLISFSPNKTPPTAPGP
jgi:hypothetical protein